MRKHLFLWLFALMASMPVFLHAEPRISVTDNSIADWNNLPAAYVQQAVCPNDAAMFGLTSMKVYADQQYIFLLVEPNMEDITDLEWVPFHVILDTDNSDATGGYGDQFTDANTDILLEGALFAYGNPSIYEPAAFKWWGEVGGYGWEWVNPAVEHDASDCWGALVCEGALSGCSSQYVNGKFEIQIERAGIPATWNSNQFGIGVDIQQNWSSVGILPIASATDENPAGKASKLKVTIEPNAVPQVPSDAVLADYYDQGNVCVCINVPGDMACNDIVLTGSFNGWSSTPSQCVPFEAVEGYDGWYVASFTPEAEPDAEKGIQVKPVILDVDGNFNWEYQIGAATVIRGGVQVVQGAYAGEIDLINYGTDAPNVFSVDAWKQNPCTAIYHNYKITVVSDGCNGLVVPYLVGAMNGWSFQQMQLDAEATNANGVPTYSISFKAAEGTPYQIVSGLLDENGEIEDYPSWNDNAYIEVLVDGVWSRYNPSNSLTGENANIVYDLRNEDLRWARCDNSPMEYVVMYVNLPTLNRPDAVEVIGGFDNWEGSTMELLENGWYFIELEAKADQFFKFRSAGSWDTELEFYDAENDEWSAISDGLLVFGQLWDDDTWKGNPCKFIELDFSDPDLYRWTVPYVFNPTNCAEAREAALSVSTNYELYNNGAVYTIYGYVTSIQTEYSEYYGNITFWMADNVNGGQVLEAWRAACASEEDAPRVGDYVAVTGTLTKYGSTPEFSAGSTFTIIRRAEDYSTANVFWPIIMDEAVIAQYASSMVASFCANEIDRFFYIWENTYYAYMDGDALTMTVANQEWAGAGLDVQQGTSFTAAEDLFESIKAHPEYFYLHLSVRSSDNASHSFRLFNSEQLDFTLGTTDTYSAPIYGDFARDNQWHDVNIPMSYFANVLNSVTLSTYNDMNIFIILSEGISGATIGLKDVYFYTNESPISSVVTPIEQNCTVNYVDMNEGLIDTEIISLNLPEAPEFDGFTFVKWIVLAGDLSEGITIQAVYEYIGDATNAPEIVENPKNSAQKLIRNGNVYILHGDQTYTITGQKVK